MTFASLEFYFRFGNRCLGVRKGWDLDKYISSTVSFLFDPDNFGQTQIYRLYSGCFIRNESYWNLAPVYKTASRITICLCPQEP